MKTILKVSIPKSELGEYKDYINSLFVNENGVLNICTNEENIMKSNQWFKNLPVKTYVISDNPIKDGDKFIATCANKDLDEKVFKLVGKNKEGIDLIDIEDELGEKHVSTIHLLRGAWKFEGLPTMEQLEQVVKRQTTSILL